MTPPPSTSPAIADPAVHALDAAAVAARLAVTPSAGLDDAEVRARRARHGENRLPVARGEAWYRLLWRQLRSPLVLVLVGAGLLATALGAGTDGAVVLGVVVVNTLIGFVQEWRAGRAIGALATMITERPRVRRAGVSGTVPAHELVPGDVVLLEAGDQVAADLRLHAVRGLETTEAALTGESLPVHKATAPVAVDATLGDRRSMAFAGTIVTAGTGEGIVVATGAATELGRISALLATASPGETPLVQALGRVARLLTAVIAVVAIALAGVAVARDYAPADAVLAAITLAVAAIPEGLPAITTIALAIGVRRMARRNAVVRNLPAVETLGGVTVICSDKTGTLTRNEMTVQALWTPTAGAWRVDGVGYAPEGAIVAVDDVADDAPAGAAPLPAPVRDLLEGAVLCSDARLVRAAAAADATGPVDPRWRIDGDPTEGALVVAARKAGMTEDTLRAARPRRDAIPFESARQWMATCHDDPARPGGTVLLVKGAPERLLPRCARDRDGAPLDGARASREADALAARGLRVLAVAVAPLDVAGAPDDDALPPTLALLGLVGMMDPPRPEAIDAIARCREAGIAVAMITGDHRDTALAIAGQLGLVAPGAEAEAQATTGDELARTDDAALRALVRERRVFARVSPEQKLRLVRALQAEGHVVAMTGDGVNDAPALRQAEIGVAMGITGTAASREAADIVLADDDFATIAAAVAEGRRVYDNLRKALAFVLPTNLGEALVILIAVCVFPVVDGTPLLPMAPVQILWINLVATVALALPLAFEAREPDVMRRPPRPPGTPLLDGFVRWRTVIVALVMTVMALALFSWEHARMLAGGVPPAIALREAQTLVVSAVVLMQMAYVVQCRSLTSSARAVGLWRNRWIWVGIGVLALLQLAFVHAPPLQRAFGSASLDAAAWARAALAAATIVPVVAIEKWWRRRVPPASPARALSGRAVAGAA